jgi:hypothetical protein
MWFVIAFPIVLGAGIAARRWLRQRRAEVDGAAWQPDDRRR